MERPVRSIAKGSGLQVMVKSKPLSDGASYSNQPRGPSTVSLAMLMLSAGWSVLEADPVPLTPTRQRQAVKFFAVVDVY